MLTGATFDLSRVDQRHLVIQDASAAFEMCQLNIKVAMQRLGEQSATKSAASTPGQQRGAQKKKRKAMTRSACMSIQPVTEHASWLAS